MTRNICNWKVNPIKLCSELVVMNCRRELDNTFTDYERGTERNVAHYSAVCYVVSGNMRDVIFNSMAYIQCSGSSNF